MFTKFQHRFWVFGGILLLIFVISIISYGGGCSSDNPPPLLVQGYDDEFAAFKGYEYFQVNVPPGEYLLTYRTNVSTYDTVFRATESALLNRWLQPGEQVSEAALWKGTITAGQAIALIGTVVYIIEPGSGIPWETVFVKAADEAPIILISQGSPVVRALPDPELIRPTPTPEPTPSPEPTLTPEPPTPTPTWCGGVEVGGYCWYDGGAGQSCDTVCDSHGGYNDGTRTYAGSDGTISNCKQVLDALGISSPSPDVKETFYSFGGLGCFSDGNIRNRIWLAHTPTTSHASMSTARRVCACNN